MKLFIDGKEAVKGQDVRLFTGEHAALVGWDEPHKPNSSGHVTVRLSGDCVREYFPGVIGGEFK